MRTMVYLTRNDVPMRHWELTEDDEPLVVDVPLSATNAVMWRVVVRTGEQDGGAGQTGD